MLKLSMVIILLFMTGCTINGKSLDEMMVKEENLSHVDRVIPETIEVKEVKKSTSKIHFKWANKEYHEGEEDINFTVK